MHAVHVHAASRARRAVLGWAVVAGLLLGAALATGEGAAGAQPVGDVAAGETLYQLHCAACHSPDGRGGFVPRTQDPVPPIAGSDRVTVSYARLTLRTGRMPPASDPYDNRPRSDVLDRREQDAVLAFMVERFGLEGDVADPGLGDAAAGLDHYATNCAQCHGATGGGGVAGGGAWTPPIADSDPLMVADAVRTGPFAMPRFGEEQLDDAAIADIAAFLHLVGEEEATVLRFNELNPVYASAFAGLLTLSVLVCVWLVAGRPFWFRSEEPPEEEDA